MMHPTLHILTALLLVSAPALASSQEEPPAPEALPEPEEPPTPEGLAAPEAPKDMEDKRSLKDVPVQTPRANRPAREKTALVTLTSGRRVCGDVMHLDARSIVVMQPNGVRTELTINIIEDMRTVISCNNPIAPPRPRSLDNDRAIITAWGTAAAIAGYIGGIVVFANMDPWCGGNILCTVPQFYLSASVGSFIGANVGIGAAGLILGRPGDVGRMFSRSIQSTFAFLLLSPLTLGFSIPVSASVGASQGYFSEEAVAMSDLSIVPLEGGAYVSYGFRF